MAGTDLPDCSGRTVLVTGATSGIVRAAAVRLGRAGARVLVHGRDGDAGSEVIAEIEAAGGTTVTPRSRPAGSLAADRGDWNARSRRAVLIDLAGARPKALSGATPYPDRMTGEDEEPPEGGLVDWTPWGPEPFERARARGRPILLSLSAPWCTACREMDRTTYADPRIAAHVDDGFVAVRADADRHPRVRERYAMGGFPSTAFLTPEGRVITGTSDPSPETMRSALDAARRAWDAQGTEAGRVPRALRDPDPPRGTVDARVEADMVERVAAAFDGEFGGWGTDAKFPLPRTVEFACKRDRDRATRTLEAIHAHLYDTYDGGFYRYAAARDWSHPHREKLLDENAALVRAFATGYLYTGAETYREAAAGTVEYLTTDLWIDGDGPTEGAGGFAASQAGGDYFTLEPTEREAADPPRIDRTVYPDRNGLAADALFRLSAYTGDRRPRRYAERALDRVCETLVADDGTVRHADDPAAESCLLIDHARLLCGLTTAVGVTGADRYLSTARAVADRALDLQADDGAFLDGPAAGPGLLDRPLRPLEANAECADALIDLAYLTGEDRYREAAGGALAAFAGAADRMGAEVAGYAAACARHHDDPLVVETPAAGSRLHRAAWRIADHEKIVVPGAREADAVVVRAGERLAPAGTPEELVERAAEDPRTNGEDSRADEDVEGE